MSGGGGDDDRLAYSALDGRLHVARTTGVPLPYAVFALAVVLRTGALESLPDDVGVFVSVRAEDGGPASRVYAHAYVRVPRSEGGKREIPLPGVVARAAIENQGDVGDDSSLPRAIGLRRATRDVIRLLIHHYNRTVANEIELFGKARDAAHWVRGDASVLRGTER